MPIDWIGDCFLAQVRCAVHGLERRATSVVLAGSPKTGCDSESDNDTTQPSVFSPLPSVLLTSRFFAGREDSFRTPEHHGVFSDSVFSPLTSAFSAAGGWRDESPHTLWLRPSGCDVFSGYVNLIEVNLSYVS
jgi:hypothetical protein